MNNTNVCRGCDRVIRGKLTTLSDDAQGSCILIRAGSFWRKIVNGTGREVACQEEIQVNGQTRTFLFCTECGIRRRKAAPYRNTREWRALGYRPMFRELSGEAVVFMADPAGVSPIYMALVNKGEWMSKTDLTDRAAWSEISPSAPNAPALYAEVRTVLAACYCTQVTEGCDFCNNRRKPEIAPEVVDAITTARDVLASHVRAKGLVDEREAR